MKKKILSGALALMVVLETATTAFAAGDGTYNVTDYTASEVESEMNDDNGVVSTEVTIKGGDNGKSGFAVILPKTMDGITVDKAINWKYNVTVSGDIAGDEYVSIVPEETFALKQDNKDNITASVDQPVTKFRDSLYNGILEADTVKMNPVGGTDVSTTGNVTASGIGAGTWKGSFWFNINMNEVDNKILQIVSDTDVMEPGTSLSVDVLLDADDVTDEVTITSDNPNVTVNENGNITISSEAQVGDIVTLTATYGRRTAVKQFTISKVENPVTLEAGLYDADDNLLVTWEDSGIDVEKDYSSDKVGVSTTSGYYVITNNYPTATKVVLPDSVTSIGQAAFARCENLTSVTISDSVTSIGYQAFYSCYALTNVTIGNSVISIGTGAFIYCNKLTSIEIPDSVTSIGNAAFQSCTNLASVTIGNSVTSIGNIAFDNCTNLTSVTIPNSVTKIGDYAFENCTNLASVTIGNSVTTFGKSVFSYCTSLTNVTIQNGVATIGEYMFYGCTSLTGIIIPNSVTSIGNRAFYDCTSLTSITIGNSVTSIGHYALKGCQSLTSIEIPDGVTSIGDDAFKDCTNLASVTIGNSVTSIGNNAFDNCSSLISIEIPDSVTSIGKYAFYNCTGISSATFANPSGWYVGSSTGAKTTAISSSDLSNASTAATYLKSTYRTKYWTR